jgi:hypothetical protein
MGKERYYENSCPVCGKFKLSRIRDMGKKCKSCNMRNVEVEFRHIKIKLNKLTGAEHCKKSRLKYKDDISHRLNILLQQAKIRSKKKNAEFNLTLQDLLDLYPQDGMCPVFKMPIQFNTGEDRTNSPSIDRVDASKGYTKDNIRIISWKANRMKSNATLADLEALVIYMKV